MGKRFGFRLDKDDLLEGPLIEWLDGLSRFRRGEWIRRQLLAAYYSQARTLSTRQSRAERVPRRDTSGRAQPKLSGESVIPSDPAGPARAVETGHKTQSGSASVEAPLGSIPSTPEPRQQPPQIGSSTDKPFSYLKGIIQPE